MNDLFTARPSTLNISLTEETATNTSSPSSGRSTPSFRRRPKKPEIHLSDLNKPYKDYIEILRAESLSSLHNGEDTDGSESNRNSFLDISEEMIAKAFMSSQFQREMNDDDSDEMHEFERTLEVEPILDSWEKNMQYRCDKSPSSPVTAFLQPLLADKTYDTFYKTLSRRIQQVSTLEGEQEEVSALKVKIAVLQEENRQLSTLLQQRRQQESTKPIVHDIALQKDYEFLTEVAHKQTLTETLSNVSIGAGGTDVGLQKDFAFLTEVAHKQTLTETPSNVSVGVEEMDVAKKNFHNVQTICEKESTKSTIHHVGLQKDFAFLTEVAHKQTLTEAPSRISVGVGGVDVAEISFTDVEVQFDKELFSRHVESQYDIQNIHDSFTQTQTIITKSTGSMCVDNRLVESKGIQITPYTTINQTQTERLPTTSAAIMVGCSTWSFDEKAIGDDVCERFYQCQYSQTYVKETSQKHVQTNTCFHDRSTETESKGFLDRPVHVSFETKDFCCGDDIADKLYAEKAMLFKPECSDLSVNTVVHETNDFCGGEGIANLQLVEKATLIKPECNDIAINTSKSEMKDFCGGEGIANLQLVEKATLIKPECSDIAINTSKSETKDFCGGEGIANLLLVERSTLFKPECNDLGINTVACETRDFCGGEGIAHLSSVEKATLSKPRCSDMSISTDIIITKSVGVGEKFQTEDTSCGEYKDNGKPCCIDDVLCGCVEPETVSIAIGQHTIDDNYCDRCDNLSTKTVAISDHTISDSLCDKCDNIQTKDMAIGDGDVNQSACETCASKDENIFNFEMNFSTTCQPQQQQPVLCHYCGNKVDLNDTSLDESLQAMRESMQSISSGMKRTDTRKNLNLELDDCSSSSTTTGASAHKNNVNTSDSTTPLTDEEDEPTERYLLAKILYLLAKILRMNLSLQFTHNTGDNTNNYQVKPTAVRNFMVNEHQ